MRKVRRWANSGSRAYGLALVIRANLQGWPPSCRPDGSPPPAPPRVTRRGPRTPKHPATPATGRPAGRPPGGCRRTAGSGSGARRRWWRRRGWWSRGSFPAAGAAALRRRRGRTWPSRIRRDPRMPRHRRWQRGSRRSGTAGYLRPPSGSGRRRAGAVRRRGGISSVGLS